jgi:DNA anti-recombination protein RmuC
MAQDVAYFKAQAERCRRLARASAEREANILNGMAAEFDAKAAELGQTRLQPLLQVRSEP